MSGRDAIERLISAIESRDLRAVEDALTPDATWQNVPSPAADDRDAVIGLLAPIIRWSDEVRWDVITAAYDDERGWLERVDRFVILGEELAVRCNGVFEVRDGRVAGVRDYVDLAEWRARAEPVLGTLRARAPIDVVRRHLEAVRSGDAVAMAADYALDAELVRGEATRRGWRQIADYFDTVPPRLGGRRLGFTAPVAVGGRDVIVTWSIEDGPSGRDRYEVGDGLITRQSVDLDGTDF